MRKEQSQFSWSWENENSAYKKSDYQNKFYNGKWQKGWIKDISKYALDRDVSIYKAMQIKHLEKREHMPKQLFKFFPFNQNSIKCIETNTVFMNNPKNFNDPFDCLLCVDKKEFIKKCLIEKLIETRAVERGILSEEELMKLETSEFEENQSYFSNRNTFERILFELKYDVNNQKERVGADEIYRIIRQINEEYSKGLES